MRRTVLLLLISTVLAQEQYSKDTQYITGSQYRAHDQYRTNTQYNTESHYSTDDQYKTVAQYRTDAKYSSEDQYYNPQHISDTVQESPSFLGSELEKISGTVKSVILDSPSPRNCKVTNKCWNWRKKLQKGV